MRGRAWGGLGVPPPIRLGERHKLPRNVRDAGSVENGLGAF